MACALLTQVGCTGGYTGTVFFGAKEKRVDLAVGVQYHPDGYKGYRVLLSHPLIKELKAMVHLKPEVGATLRGERASRSIQQSCVDAKLSDRPNTRVLVTLDHTGLLEFQELDAETRWPLESPPRCHLAAQLPLSVKTDLSCHM